MIFEEEQQHEIDLEGACRAAPWKYVRNFKTGALIKLSDEEAAAKRRFADDSAVREQVLQKDFDSSLVGFRPKSAIPPKLLEIPPTCVGFRRDPILGWAWNANHAKDPGNILDTSKFEPREPSK